MRISELLSGIAVFQSGDPETEIREICFDSRQAGPGILFVALTGAMADGHAYLDAAYQNGCRSFLAERDVTLPADACVYRAENTRRALALAAQRFYRYPDRQLRVIGITGTKGKTTSSLMLRTILDHAGMPCGYIGSNGVEYGDIRIPTSNTTPESLILYRLLRRMADAGMRCAVIEVSSQALTHFRVEGLRFYACAFTNLYPDHIGIHEHPTFEDYRNAKRRLFETAEAAFFAVNADDPAGAYMIRGTSVPLVYYSADGAEQAEIRAEDIRMFRTDSSLGVSFTMCGGTERQPVTLSVPGEFNVANALCAASIARKMGVSLSDTAAALAACRPRGRFELVPSIPDVTVLIDYAHNGASLSHALSLLRSYQPERIVCLFGSVGGRTTERRREMAEAAGAFADLCILTSDNPDYEDPMRIIGEIDAALPPKTPRVRIPLREEAIRYALRNARRGDVILLAGKGHEDYQLIRGVKEPFSERSIVSDESRIIMEQSHHGPDADL